MPSHAALTSFIVATAKALLERSADIGIDDDLFEAGLDSIDAVELTAAIETRWELLVDPALPFEERTASRIAATLCSGMS